MSATEELKPCPFCGCEDIDEYEGDYGNGVYCMNCGAMVGEPIHMEFRTNERVTYEQAAEAWNTRTPEQAIAATLGKQGYYTDRDDEGTHIMCDRCGEYIGTAEEIAATLGGGKLTAEQVREAIERNFSKVAVLDDGEPVEWRDDWVCKVGINYKAIADELNAELRKVVER